LRSHRGGGSGLHGAPNHFIGELELLQTLLELAGGARTQWFRSAELRSAAENALHLVGRHRSLAKGGHADCAWYWSVFAPGGSTGSHTRNTKPESSLVSTSIVPP